MNNTVVVYKSKYGSTKKYAEWIAEELGSDIIENKSIKIDSLSKYNTIIYGGGLYAGGINGVSLITDNFDQLQDKKLIIFTCGLADTKSEENIKGIHNSIDKVFTKEMKEKVKFFHLRGGIDYSKLTIAHKLMMGMLKKAVSKKNPEDLKEEDREMLETYGKKVDFTDKNSIKPLIDYIRE